MGSDPTIEGDSGQRWEGMLSATAQNLRESEIRALFSVVSRPEVVSLAGGMPNLADLPLNAIGEMTDKLLVEDGQRALQYGDGHGWDPLREKIVEVMAKESIVGDPCRIQVTTGSQQALDLISEIFLNPGDVVLAESPSYVGALGVFRSRVADVVHVEMDDHGLVPDALRSAIKDTRAQGREIKFLYTIPNYHNPAGVSLSEERRPEIADICRSEGILDSIRVPALRCRPTGQKAWSTWAPFLRSLRPATALGGRLLQRRSTRSWCWPLNLPS